MATDYGTDIHCVDDVDRDLSLVSGPLGVAEAVARRLITPRGRLWYAPDYGTDIRAYLNSELRPFQIARDVEAEALKDERVIAADAEVIRSTADTLEIRLLLTLGDGPFAFVLTITQVSASVLAA